jgi:hypothetical protein
MSNNWIEYVWNDESTHPEQNKKLWYFFDFVGVHQGQYYGDWTFAGDKGFLGGDVTHWQYDVGQEKPEPPRIEK